jgi:hypothetical protein
MKNTRPVLLALAALPFLNACAARPPARLAGRDPIQSVAVIDELAK